MSEEQLKQQIEKLEKIIQHQGFNLLAIHQLTKLIVSNSDVRQIFFLVTDMFAEIMRLEYCMSFIYNRLRKRFEFSYQVRSKEHDLNSLHFTSNASLANAIFSTQMLDIDDELKARLSGADINFLKKTGAKHIIPLKEFDQYLGFIIFGPGQNGIQLEPADRVLIETMQGIIDTAVYSAVITEYATEDSQTGLMTEKYFKKRVEEQLALARRYNFNFSVALLKINNIKELADGGASAQEVRNEVASVLKSTFRITDYVAKYREDVFAVLLNRTIGENITTPFERIRKNLGHISITVGAASFPTDGQDADSLFDVAEYRLGEAVPGEIAYI